MDVSPIQIILIAVFTGFGIEAGKMLFEQIKKRWAIHKEHAMKFGQKIGSGINKTFINKEGV